MTKNWKRWLSFGAVFSVGLVGAVKAMIPAAVFVWFGASTALATAIEASLYVHAAAFAIYEVYFAEKGSDGQPSGSPMLTVKISPSAARSNPDPSKFNDPAPGERDVTPKATVPAVAGGASPKPLVSGSLGLLSFCGGNGNAYGSTMSTVASACVSLLNRAWEGVSPKPTYSVLSCNESSCEMQRSAFGDTAAFNFPIDSRTVQIPAGMNCPSGAYDAVAGSCVADSSGTTCPAGYTKAADGSCSLTNPAAVKKPVSTPCEVLRTASGMQLDSANPNCEGLQLAGNALTVGDQSVSFNADGSMSVANPSGQTTLQLGTPNSDGSVPVTGASRTGNPASHTPGSGGSGSVPTCGGAGQPACSGTGGAPSGSGGSCGGTGQPKCSLDDSGFNGLGDPSAAGTSALGTALGDRENAIRDATDNGSNLNLGFDWVPKPGNWGVTCKPITIHWMRSTFQWDICPYLALASQAMGYMFYLFAGLYIWRSFISSNSGGK